MCAQVPNSTAFHAGRFSNGPLWVDYVKHATNAEVLNYAIAGGLMCAGNAAESTAAAFPDAPLSLEDQLAHFKRDLRKERVALGERAVAIIW